jgi:maleylpyruvate isomerase
MPAEAQAMELFSYYQSSAAYRVRIGLNLKRIRYEIRPIDLLKDGGENRKLTYLVINPQGKVPALTLDDGRVLLQSLAILEYLDERVPLPPFLPEDLQERARVRAVANMIACDIHPLNNLRVLKYLSGPLEQPQEVRDDWYRHWVTEGFRAIEAIIDGDDFCFGDKPTLADICLIPQVFNARRINMDLSAFPKIVAVDKRATVIPAFAAAHPLAQPDAPQELAAKRPAV